MTITRIAPTATVTSAASSASPSAAATSTVDYTEFLQLFVGELQNQDPTSPTDPTQYMSQLASFSSLEQQVQTNSTLDSLHARSNPKWRADVLSLSLQGVKKFQDIHGFALLTIPFYPPRMASRPKSV